MKVKIILGVFIALTLVLTLSLPAVAGKPIPEVSIGSITYVDNPGGSVIDQITVGNISWQNAHPKGYNLYLYSPDDSKGLGAYWYVLPKGKAAKYPQNASRTWGIHSITFTDGNNVQVSFRLVNTKGVVIVDTGVVTNITWGTSSSWTAP